MSASLGAFGTFAAFSAFCAFGSFCAFGAFTAFEAFAAFDALADSAALRVVVCVSDSVVAFAVFVVFVPVDFSACTSAAEVAFCDALLRRSARADPEDFTMFSLRQASNCPARA
ncbi:hypothetical protein F4827_003743 [Paraburkholderia bannensis]|uniref:Uncharacterized protein n=1 Tax=Paraburkholderia bannensis TaxID=765414 RepID=A0A7W9WUJ7_9BURK|nr:hypothetical protein [Paraburkholderia bannensis]MBB3258874.1 hypothetical protein [Paraburkholderia sp. WP4_3_2]MBB6103888.1 hypothetical protein [Paraburkholderia bannensis]